MCPGLRASIFLVPVPQQVHSGSLSSRLSVAKNLMPGKQEEDQWPAVSNEADPEQLQLKKVDLTVPSASPTQYYICQEEL